jgi:hypothetical protein
MGEIKRFPFRHDDYVPLTARYLRGLPPTEEKVGLAITWLALTQGNGVFLGTIEEIAAAENLTRREVTKAIRALKCLEYLLAARPSGLCINWDGLRNWRPAHNARLSLADGSAA